VRRVAGAVLAVALLIGAAAPASAQAPPDTELFEGYNRVTYPENFFQGWPIDWQPIGVADAVYRYDPASGWLGWFRPVALGELPALFNNFWTMTPGLEYWVFVTAETTITWYE
jgi:hypothetical protein